LFAVTLWGNSIHEGIISNKSKKTNKTFKLIYLLLFWFNCFLLNIANKNFLHGKAFIDPTRARQER